MISFLVLIFFFFLLFIKTIGTITAIKITMIIIDKIIEKFTDLNNIIKKDRTLGKSYTIGHSYFCDKLDDEEYKNIIEYEIAPTLREYWFDNEEKAEKEIKKLLDI